MPTDTSKCPLVEKWRKIEGITCSVTCARELESYWREKVMPLIEAAESHECTGGHCSIRAALARLTEEK